jgi:Stage II sporulation protein E (SpoIIE)
VLTYDESHQLEPKSLYRRIESLLERMPGVGSPRSFAKRLLPALLDEFGASPGVFAAQLYERGSGGWSLVQHDGEAVADLSAWMDPWLIGDNAGVIAELPWAGICNGGLVALAALGTDCARVIALHLRQSEGPASSPAGLMALISPLHHAASHHLRRRELEDLIEQARAIQLSLLPASSPKFGDFDIAAVSIPARIVGGDFYDFLPLDADTLALTIADASGHGLPAALQARDVATGLRMGVERDFKITRTVEKLNRVIHRSGLVSRFISMVFGELEANGNLAYINAGHPPPLLLDDAGVHELAVGGMILGPTTDATYKLGFAHVDRGASLVLFTDGVIECGTERGDAFGLERLTTWLRDWREGPAERAVTDLIERLRLVAKANAFEDDVTVVFIRRPRS